MTQEHLIIVDRTDRPLGTIEKMEGHRKGLRHRAFSVMIYNPEGQLLIQKRALGKYHSGGLWANSCCGHPRPNEETLKAAQRRLYEELGFSCPLELVGTVCYTLSLDNGLHENEFTHIFRGLYEGHVNPNPQEACEVKWLSPKMLLHDAKIHQNQYARWFQLYLFKYFDFLDFKKSI